MTRVRFEREISSAEVEERDENDEAVDATGEPMEFSSTRGVCGTYYIEPRRVKTALHAGTRAVRAKAPRQVAGSRGYVWAPRCIYVSQLRENALPTHSREPAGVNLRCTKFRGREPENYPRARRSLLPSLLNSPRVVDGRRGEASSARGDPEIRLVVCETFVLGTPSVREK